MKTKRMGKFPNRMFGMVLILTILFAIFTQNALTAEVRIDFTTTGDSTTMRCDFAGTATAVWHWSDGTTTAAVSGASVTKGGLGSGTHLNYLTVSDHSALTWFGAGNTGQGHLVSISGLQNCPNMAILYTYQENSLTSIGDVSTTTIREYHLMNTSLSAAELDGIFADAVASEVRGGTLWADNSGTSASDADKATLQARGWTLNIPPWTPQTPAPITTPSPGDVNIDFITAGDSTTMRCDFGGSTTAVWHWSDGTATVAVSGAPVTKSGLGLGTHLNYLTVSNDSALTRFGAGNAGQGHLVLISGLQNCPNMAILYAYQENSLTAIGNTSSAKIREYHLMGASLSAAELDGILADAVTSGVQGGTLWADNSGTSTSDTDKATLRARGWTLNIPAWTPQTPTPTPTTPPVTGGVNIDFTTTGDSTTMSCNFNGTATAIWHWADGTTQTAVSGAPITKNGLGAGTHQNYLTVSNGSALTWFGAGNAGQGHLVSISGLQNCPNLAILYAYQEISLTSIDDVSATIIREYHLANTGLSATMMDGIFADAVASGVQGGILWSDTSGTSASNADKSTLQARGWTLNIPTWIPQTPTSTPTTPPLTGGVNIDFTTTGDSTTMRCDFFGTATAVWHWDDGTTQTAVSGAPITKSGLGAGTHQNYLTVSNGSALTWFGAGNTGQAHLVSINGLQNCPNMAILYAYQESSLTSIGNTNATIIREYHLMNTSLSAAMMDGIFANAVASEVVGGTLWADNSGTSASDANKATLQARGWTLNIPAWIPQTPTPTPNPTPTHTPTLTGGEGAITFITEGSTFAPVIQVAGNAQVTWTFADGTTSSSNTPVKDYGSAGTRAATLVIAPWSAVIRINIGYDAGDGGSSNIEFVANQNVSAVWGLSLARPYLRQWCSSYNQITALDFSNFIQLDTIECYLSHSLTSVNLANTPALRRACFEDCDLHNLDLSGCPNLEDLRGANNAYPDINFGSTGAHLWHICIRDNPQITNQSLFQDMSRFPNIAQLFIWNDNQAGGIRIPSSSRDNGVAFLASGNRYTDLNLQGSLQLASSPATVDFSNNLLTNVDLTGCTQITTLNLQNNHLSGSETDEILAALDSLGRTRDNTPSWAELYVDISGGGNQQPSPAGYASALSLSRKGWTVIATGWTMLPSSPAETGAARIDFTTIGDSTTMRCDFIAPAAAVWHWSDGTTTIAASNTSVTKSGLGDGTHQNYLTISNGSALIRFGAGNAGQGHLLSISGLQNCPELGIVYAYLESSLTSIGDTSTAKVDEYHLMGTQLSAAEMDRIFADAVASGAQGGIIYGNNSGTPASDGNKSTLQARGWTIY